ncbi:IS1 family transposase, partial [Salmonella enterica subsp. enterica]|nr:IS1 family transposase [Salmonella enterica subsp. enterica]
MPTIQHLLPAKPDDILELDEMWTFVQKRDNKQWLWLALCRRTKQIVGYYIGDRGIKACK